MQRDYFRQYLFQKWYKYHVRYIFSGILQSNSLTSVFLWYFGFLIMFDSNIFVVNQYQRDNDALGTNLIPDLPSIKAIIPEFLLGFLLRFSKRKRISPKELVRRVIIFKSSRVMVYRLYHDRLRYWPFSLEFRELKTAICDFVILFFIGKSTEYLKIMSL